MTAEEDYLQLSGIQHFSFCKRQWALIHIENQWSDNLLTVEGEIMHTRAHNPFENEKRGDKITTREMNLLSHTLGVTGKCDVVEFYRDDNGVSLHGQEGLWRAYPVEYKHGTGKVNDCDRLQLCGQAICLEEMLLCGEIPQAAIYYGQPHRREVVDLTAELRQKVAAMFEEMRGYYARQHTPRVKSTKACASCSMKDICLPKLPKNDSVRSYIALQLNSEG
jgi:CRISPR-associated exonuclease Cas4